MSAVGDARKRAQEKASTPDDLGIDGTEDLIDLLDEAADAMHDAARGRFVNVRPLQEQVLAAWLAEHDAQVRAEALDVCAALLDRVVTYWGGRPLSAGHGVNLYADVRDVLRGIERDRDHHRAIARQSVEGGGER